MKILILGGSGMLGYQLFSYLRVDHTVRVSLRDCWEFYQSLNLFPRKAVYTDVKVDQWQSVEKVICHFKPQVVINAVGIVKQRQEGSLIIPCLKINALFPHLLAAFCSPKNIQVVHISTDCVFSGKKGYYKNDDFSDAEDLYGRTKYLGEVAGALTLRTSIIGKELFHKQGLYEWVCRQRGEIKGFKNAIFSGFTTLELSYIIEMMIMKYPTTTGIYNVSSNPINKYDLLVLLKKSLNLPVQIKEDKAFYCDRSLDSTIFRDRFNYIPPPWKEMIEDMVAYDSNR